MSRSVWLMIVADSNLSSTDRHLLRVVAAYEGELDWPTAKQIAADMGVTPVTVWTHLPALREQGWLVRDDGVPGVGGRPPTYRPAIPAKILPLMLDASG
jgi:predicted ArsR family transcriptional regulator